MRYKLIIFDFDGTIADTSEGIIDAHKYVFKNFNRDIPSESFLRNLIGGNLLYIYNSIFEFPLEDAKQAVTIYRGHYAEDGIHKAVLYKGFDELLKRIKQQGIYIAVATLKAERFAKAMLDELGISEYIDYVSGMDNNDELNKSTMINRCIDYLGCDSNQVVLVGDSNNDYIGAIQSKIDFVGVRYGFGYKNNEELEFPTATDVDDLYELLV